MRTLLRLVLLAVPLALAGPAPAAQVPRGYAEAERAVGEQGRAAVELVRARDAEALHARFAAPLADEVPLGRLRALLDETFGAVPLGERLREARLPLGAGMRAYAADHRWGERVLGVQIAFDRQGRMASFALVPREPLGRDPGAGRGTTLRLPLAGRWWVYWGGASELRNYHVAAPAQRHAIDLVRWRGGGTARGDGTRNRDYWAWGARVVAPADGVVVAARDGVPDNRPRVEVTNRREPGGNHVVIDLGRGVYAALAHLREGTVTVRPGDRVRAGEPLGRVGNSGNSSEPHLHFHLQDRPRFGYGTGLPVRFRDVLVDGEPRRVAAARQGAFLEPAPRRGR